MPYIDLVSGDDYASIWYDTNAPNGNVGGFDPDKPTIVMLHPLFLDSTWLYPQMDDHRLNSQYNIIVFDARCTGKSLCRPSGKYDLWVSAADLASCFHVCYCPAISACSVLSEDLASSLTTVAHLRTGAELLRGPPFCGTVSYPRNDPCVRVIDVLPADSQSSF